MERRQQKLLPIKMFAKRQLNYAVVSAVIIAFSLIIGTLGYAYFGELNTIDSFYNASMILTGMGPVNPMNTFGGKMFASLYALFSGVAFLSTIAVLFAPMIHRLLHMMHVEDDEREEL